MTAKAKHGLEKILDQLARYYGPGEPGGPDNPYEMILSANCGYPATDVSCAKGFNPLKAEVATEPGKILQAPSAQLAKLTRDAGMFPELRAERLKLIARIATENFGWRLKLSAPENDGGPEDACGEEAEARE